MLEQHRRFGGGNPRQGRGHVEQIAFVHLRHELAAGLADRPEARCEDEARAEQSLFRFGQNPIKRRAVNAGKEAIDRVAVFGGNLPPDQPAH